MPLYELHGFSNFMKNKFSWKLIFKILIIQKFPKACNSEKLIKKCYTTYNNNNNNNTFVLYRPRIEEICNVCSL